MSMDQDIAAVVRHCLLLRLRLRSPATLGDRQRQRHVQSWM